MDQSALELFRTSTETLIGKGSGNGYYSAVFQTPFPNLVIKRGAKANEDGWLAYACLVLLAGDKAPAWMPRIHALRVDYETNTFFALMDKLDRCSDDFPYNVERAFDEPRMLELQEKASNATDLEHYTKLCAVLELFRLDEKMGGRIQAMGVYLDGHLHNWMLRTDARQLVLNDPFCSLMNKEMLRVMVMDTAHQLPHKVNITVALEEVVA